METREVVGPFLIVRKDRVTGDIFPVSQSTKNIGQAKLLAEIETSARLPKGDAFLVLLGNAVVYDPTIEE